MSTATTSASSSRDAPTSAGVVPEHRNSGTLRPRPYRRSWGRRAERGHLEPRRVRRADAAAEGGAPITNDGTRLTQELLADTVTGLLWLEDRLRRDVEATDAAVTVAERDDESDAEYPDVIFIDDDDDIAVA